MKNNTNIYDIDGEIIRPAGDNHQFTIDEAKEKIQYYQDKIKELSEKEDKTEEDLKKLTAYKDYCKNLMNYEWSKLMQMDRKTFTDYMSSNLAGKIGETKEEDVNKALNELKNDTETGENTVNEVQKAPSDDNESTTNEEFRDDEAVKRDVSDIHEERPVTQDSLLVERDGVVDNMNEEYVDYEEV